MVEIRQASQGAKDLRIAQGGAGLWIVKPIRTLTNQRGFVTGMIHHHVQNGANVPGAGFGQNGVKLRGRAEAGIELELVGIRKRRPVAGKSAVPTHLDGDAPVERGDPKSVGPELLNGGDPLPQSRQIPSLVGVCVVRVVALRIPVGLVVAGVAVFKPVQQDEVDDAILPAILRSRFFHLGGGQTEIPQKHQTPDPWKKVLHFRQHTNL